MGLVNLSTGEITDCKKGSRVWWHEKGHIEFNKLEWGSKIDYYQQHFMMVAVFFGAMSLLINNLYLHLFTFLNALGMICSYLYQELWAWLYSFKHYKK
jgi:hypothetical protein